MRLHGFHDCIRFCVIRLLMLKAVYRIHRESLITCKINIGSFLYLPAVAGKFYP